jgi:organic radical activating enzyme
MGSVEPDRRHDTALVTELFVSVQGEGPLSGQRCAFVRLSRCNLTCSWCDTKQTWDWSRYDREKVSSRMATHEIGAWVRECGVDLVVVTGGEPLLQQPAIAAMLADLDAATRVQVETNGTIAPSVELAARVDLWVASPKLANSGVARQQRIKPAALAALRGTGKAVFKFVVTDPVGDFDEIALLEDDFGLKPIWVMPEGETPEQVVDGLSAVTEPAVRRGWNVSSRLHILAGAR